MQREPTTAFAYCAEQVRRLDYDRYLTTLFAPAPQRRELLALYAFNIEIARIRETVSEPMLGQIRLQWWSEAIAELYAGRIRHHAVVEGLAAGVGRGGLDRALFERLIETRNFDFEDRQPRTLAELEDYAAGTSATLLKLGAQLFGSIGPPLAEALDHIGIAFALIGLIRAVPFHARANRFYLPSAVLAKRGLSEHNLFSDAKWPALRESIEEVVQAAMRHVADARRAYPRPARGLQALFLPGTLAEAYASRLRTSRSEAMRRPVEMSRLRKLALLYGAALRRRY